MTNEDAAPQDAKETESASERIGQVRGRFEAACRAGRQPSAAGKSKHRRRLGKFELIEPLGSGGFGTVYKTRDRELDRTVAIKLPRWGALGEESERERFLQEARSAAQLRHPHICPIFDVGHAEGLMFIAMGYIQGPTLRAWAAESCDGRTCSS